MRFFLATWAAVFFLSFDVNLPIKWFHQNDHTQGMVLADHRPADVILRGAIDELSSSPKLFVEPMSPTDNGDIPSSESVIEKQESELAIPEESQTPAPDFCSALKDAAEQASIPIAFFARLLWQESRFQSNEVSSAGAQGIAQFMPTTAAEVGLQNPFDPLQALPASARLLRGLHDEFGNLGLAAAAYNAGSGRIRKWLSRTSPLPRETQNYVRIITGSAAEDWSAESKTIALRMQLPVAAPLKASAGYQRTMGRPLKFRSRSILPSVQSRERRTSNTSKELRLPNC